MSDAGDDTDLILISRVAISGLDRVGVTLIGSSKRGLTGEPGISSGPAIETGLRELDPAVGPEDKVTTGGGGDNRKGEGRVPDHVGRRGGGLPAGVDGVRSGFLRFLGSGGEGLTGTAALNGCGWDVGGTDFTSVAAFVDGAGIAGGVGTGVGAVEVTLGGTLIVRVTGFSLYRTSSGKNTSAPSVSC